MVTTNFLGLKVWNLSTDPYDSGQLADNWARVDEHDHSNGKGKQIPTGGIADGSITSAKLASGLALATGQIVDPGTGKVIGSNGAGSAAPVNPPGYQFGYDQITATVNVTATVEATGTTVISCAAHTFDGAPVVAEFFCPGAEINSATASTLFVSLFEGATEIGIIATFGASASANIPVAIPGRMVFTPTAGPHTYTVTAYRTAANGSLIAGSGGTGAYAPTFIRFIKV